MPNETKKLTPVLFVDTIEPCLSFWMERFGWTKTAEVPGERGINFAIVAKNGVELMYQTWESAREDVGSVRSPGGTSVGLFIEVSDLDAVERQVRGLDIALARRRTFYGMNEIGVREPGGHLVIFAQPAAVQHAG
jgi:hypothetical protein